MFTKCVCVWYQLMSVRKTSNLFFFFCHHFWWLMHVDNDYRHFPKDSISPSQIAASVESGLATDCQVKATKTSGWTLARPLKWCRIRIQSTSWMESNLGTDCQVKAMEGSGWTLCHIRKQSTAWIWFIWTSLLGRFLCSPPASFCLAAVPLVWITCASCAHVLAGHPRALCHLVFLDLTLVDSFSIVWYTVIHSQNWQW